MIASIDAYTTYIISRKSVIVSGSFDLDTDSSDYSLIETASVMSEKNLEEGSCCPICLEPLVQNDDSLRIGATVPCGHCFHVTCWKQSFASASNQRRSNARNCPTCNSVTKVFMRLYLNAPTPSKPKPHSPADTTTATKHHAPVASNPGRIPTQPVASSMGTQPTPFGSQATVRFPFHSPFSSPPGGTAPENFIQNFQGSSPFSSARGAQFPQQGSSTLTAAGNNSTGLGPSVSTPPIVFPHGEPANSLHFRSGAPIPTPPVASSMGTQPTPFGSPTNMRFPQYAAFPPLPIGAVQNFQGSAPSSSARGAQFPPQGSSTLTAAGNNSTGLGASVATPPTVLPLGGPANPFHFPSVAQIPTPPVASSMGTQPTPFGSPTNMRFPQDAAFTPLPVGAALNFGQNFQGSAPLSASLGVLLPSQNTTGIGASVATPRSAGVASPKRRILRARRPLQ